MRVWNTNHLDPPELRPGILNILERDYETIMRDQAVDLSYPVVINKDGELAWKEDVFVMNLFVQHCTLDLTAIAMDPGKQRFRKALYQRMGYTLRKYASIWYNS